MCASRTTGYQGFQSFGVQACPTLKPGETEARRATKFAAMAAHVLTPNAQSNRLGRHSFESVYQQSTQPVISHEYRASSRHNLLAAESSPLETRLFVAKTTYEHDFASTTQELQQVRGISLENLEHAFQAEAERAQNNTIVLAQVPRVVTIALGSVTIPRFVDALMHDLNPGHGSTSVPSRDRDRVTWDAFRKAVERTMQAIEHGVRPRDDTTAPPSPKKVLPATTPASSYQLDFGQAGESPLQRAYVRGHCMASTTDDLQPGTTKATFHVPHYGGFLPRTTHNLDAVAHSQGVTPHAARTQLRLYHRDNVPGYTGHEPVDCTNFSGACHAGSDLHTTTGASYIDHSSK